MIYGEYNEERYNAVKHEKKVKERRLKISSLF